MKIIQIIIGIIAACVIWYTGYLTVVYVAEDWSKAFNVIGAVCIIVIFFGGGFLPIMYFLSAPEQPWEQIPSKTASKDSADNSKEGALYGVILGQKLSSNDSSDGESEDSSGGDFE